MLDTFCLIPRVGDGIGGENAVLRLGLRHHVRDGVAIRDRQLSVEIDELHRHPLGLPAPPPSQQLEHDVLAADPWLQRTAEHDAPCFRQRDVDVPRRPSKPEGRGPHADTDRAVRAVCAAVRIGARDEVARRHQPLLGKVEVKDPVAGRRVVRPFDTVQPRELAANRRLPVIVRPAGENEMIVGDRGPARSRGVAGGDLIERVDREGRGAVGGRQQVGVHPYGCAGPHLRVFVHAVGPHDLLGGRQPHVRSPDRATLQSAIRNC